MQKGAWKERAFQEQMSERRDFRHGTPVRLQYAICCGHRTGSNLLGEALYQTGLAGDPMEYFNLRFLDALAAKRGSNRFDFEQFLGEMRERRTSPNGVFGINIKFDQLSILFKDHWPRAISLIRDNDLVIFLYRRDKLRQAISLYIGRSRDLFNVPADIADEKIRKLVSGIPFDPEKISACLNDCVRVEQGWQAFFKANGIAAEPLAYEDFAAGYEQSINRLLERFGVPEPERKIPAQPLKKVSNELNEQFRSRFLEYLEGSSDAWLRGPD